MIEPSESGETSGVATIDTISITIKNIPRTLYNEFCKIMIDENSDTSNFVRDAIKKKVENHSFLR